MINIVNGAKYDSLLYISCSTLGTLTLRCKYETSKITARYCSQSSLHYYTRPAIILNIVLIQLANKRDIKIFLMLQRGFNPGYDGFCE